jgi:hypothetical protein
MGEEKDRLVKRRSFRGRPRNCQRRSLLAVAVAIAAAATTIVVVVEEVTVEGDVEDDVEGPCWW